MRTRAQIRRKYTSTPKIFGKWYTFLQVEYQSFCIASKTSKRRAAWFADRLACALAKLIKENQP